MNLISGDLTGGVFQCSVVLAQFGAAGDWVVDLVSLTDAATNQVTAWEADLTAMGFPSAIVEKGQHTGRFPGQVLRRGSPAPSQ